MSSYPSQVIGRSSMNTARKKKGSWEEETSALAAQYADVEKEGMKLCNEVHQWQYLYNNCVEKITENWNMLEKFFDLMNRTRQMRIDQVRGIKSPLDEAALEKIEGNVRNLMNQMKADVKKEKEKYVIDLTGCAKLSGLAP